MFWEEALSNCQVVNYSDLQLGWSASKRLICKSITAKFETNATNRFFSYMLDEPSSYLDVKQRLNAARVIRALLDPTTFVIVVEHDLSVLDYLSDFVCVLYGVPSVYGVVTMPFSVREGMLHFEHVHKNHSSTFIRYQYIPGW
jgi:translation initiation factor RLI1